MILGEDVQGVGGIIHHVRRLDFLEKKKISKNEN